MAFIKLWKKIYWSLPLVLGIELIISDESTMSIFDSNLWSLTKGPDRVPKSLRISWGQKYLGSNKVTLDGLWDWADHQERPSHDEKLGIFSPRAIIPRGKRGWKLSLLGTGVVKQYE